MRLQSAALLALLASADAFLVSKSASSTVANYNQQSSPASPSLTVENIRNNEQRPTLLYSTTKDAAKDDSNEAEEDEEAETRDESMKMEKSKKKKGKAKGEKPVMKEEKPEVKENKAETEGKKIATLEENKTFLLSLGSIASRGEFATETQKKAAKKVVKALEAQNPTSEPCASEKIWGKWELVYSSTQLFRSSPFFMAGRAVCKTDVERAQYDWFCDMHRAALAISNIGPVRQVVSPSRLVSEFEVKAGSVPFLSDLTPFKYSGGMPVTIDGAIVSSADLTVASGNEWELYMDTVEIKGSNIPGLRPLLDDQVKLRSRPLGDFLENQIADYKNPRPIFRTTFLDDNLRISRDQDDNIFVYVKTSSDTTPTDYKSVDADFGVGKLLEGFNDAVTRFYL